MGKREEEVKVRAMRVSSAARALQESLATPARRTARRDGVS